MFSSFLNCFSRVNNYHSLLKIHFVPFCRFNSNSPEDDFSRKKNASAYRFADKPKMVNPAEFVKNAIEENKVVIFSKNGCPYCSKAKACFDKLNQKYKSFEIDEMDECDEIQDVLGSLTPARTVPRVFVKGKFIGGGSDVENKFKSGELKSILEL